MQKKSITLELTVLAPSHFVYKLKHYVKLMLFYTYFYGVNAIGDINNFLICMIIINRA